MCQEHSRAVRDQSPENKSTMYIITSASPSAPCYPRTVRCRMSGDAHFFTLSQPESFLKSRSAFRPPSCLLPGPSQEVALVQIRYSSSPVDDAFTKIFNSHRTELCFGQERSIKLGERSHGLET